MSDIERFYRIEVKEKESGTWVLITSFKTLEEALCAGIF